MHYKKLFIFHYHLRAGGITQVIERSVRVLNEKSSIQIMIIAGSDTDSPAAQKLEQLGAQVHVCKDSLINYSARSTNQDIEQLERHLLKTYHHSQALWWIHNYHLGKNPAFSAALIRIANSARQAMLLQIHDFPEENRPQNLEQLSLVLKRRMLYPYNAKTHYLVVNHHDEQRLLKAGMPKQAVSKLFNLLMPSASPLKKTLKKQEIKDILAKKFGQQFPAYNPKMPLVLYPVRAIRRKNVLEAMAINLLGERSWNLLITLAGTSVAEKNYSDLVRKLFDQLRLPGLSQIGEHLKPELNFVQLFTAADMLISTSLAEGFGYTFFEALQANKLMLARMLPVLKGFLPLFNKRQFFYKNFYLELNNKQFAQCQESLKQCVAKAPPILTKKLEKKIYELKREKIDFALFTPQVQYQTLMQLSKDSHYRRQQQLLNQELLAASQQEYSNATSVDLDSVFGAHTFYKNYQDIISKFEKSSIDHSDDNTLLISENLSNQLDDITSYSPILSDNREWQCLLEGGSFE